MEVMNIAIIFCIFCCLCLLLWWESISNDFYVYNDNHIHKKQGVNRDPSKLIWWDYKEPCCGKQYEVNIEKMKTLSFFGGYKNETVAEYKERWDIALNVDDLGVCSYCGGLDYVQNLYLDVIHPKYECEQKHFMVYIRMTTLLTPRLLGMMPRSLSTSVIEYLRDKYNAKNHSYRPRHSLPYEFNEHEIAQTIIDELDLKTMLIF